MMHLIETFNQDYQVIQGSNLQRHDGVLYPSGKD